MSCLHGEYKNAVQISENANWRALSFNFSDHVFVSLARLYSDMAPSHAHIESSSYTWYATMEIKWKKKMNREDVYCSGGKSPMTITKML